MKEKIEKNKVNIIFFAISCLISFVLIFFHEPWRDEAQQWVMVKNLSFFDFLNHLKYEGHFLLWYLILMPFAKLGFPYITQNIISWFINAISLWLFVKYAPFSNKIKRLFLFILPSIYLFPVITRCYCLIPLSIILIALLYKDRFKKPIRYILSILLLTNTHIIMFSLVSFLLIEFFIESIKERKNRKKLENKKIIISFVIAFIGLILSFLPILECLSVNKDIGNDKPLWFNMLFIFASPLIVFQNIFGIFFQNIIVCGIAIIILILLIYYEVIYHRKEALKIFIVLLWHFFIYTFIYGVSSQRACTIIWIIIFFVWTRDKKENVNNISVKIKNIVLVLFLLINIIYTLVFIMYDVLYNYSTGRQTAEYINKNIDENSVILVGGQEEFCVPIIPYLENGKFYGIQRKDYITLGMQDKINKEKLTMEKFNEAIEKFSDKNLYYIYTPLKVYTDTDTKIITKLIKEGKLKKIFDSNSDDLFVISNEIYIIFKIQNIN